MVSQHYYSDLYDLLIKKAGQNTQHESGFDTCDEEVAKLPSHVDGER